VIFLGNRAKKGEQDVKGGINGPFN